MATISIETVRGIVARAVANGGTVFIPSPEHQLESNHGYGGITGEPTNEEALVVELHGAAEYWIDQDLNVREDESREEAESRVIGRLENWIAREARDWALDRAR